MKKVTLLLTVVVLSVFLWSCGGGYGENEPNNTIEEASEIVLNKAFEIKIEPKRDHDWFKVEIPEQGYLSVKANNQPKNIKLVVRFALYQEWEGKKSKQIKGWSDMPSVLHAPKAGSYYFVIADDWDDAESSEPISIKIEFTKEFDNFEMNNNFKEAKEIKFSETVSSFIYPAGDYDWFKVKIEKKGYLKAMSSTTIKGVQPQFYFVKIDEWAAKKEQALSGWLTFPGACSVVDTGYVYLALHDKGDNGASKDAIKFKIDFIEEMDNTEPNNKFKNAFQINKSDTISLAIFPTGDNDFYKVSLEKGDKLSFIGKDWADNIKPTFQIYTLDTVKNKLTVFKGWSSLPFEFEADNSRDYYIDIHDDWDDAGSEKTFEVIVKQIIYF